MGDYVTTGRRPPEVPVTAGPADHPAPKRLTRDLANL